MEQHPADNTGDQKEVGKANPLDAGRLQFSFGNMDSSESESRTRAGVALAASGRKIICVDGRLFVG